VRKFFRDRAFELGYYLTKQVDSAEVLRLVRTLRPRHCSRPLIRVGAQSDGGYLIPDDLGGIEYCLSPGVSGVADFESHLATRNISSFLADYSVSAPPIQKPQFTFDKKNLGANDNDVFFTLQSWKNKYLRDYSGELILQMDIDGGEYEVLLSTAPELLSTFRIIVLELHFLEKLFEPFAHSIIKTCLEKLAVSFYVVHAHPNNCSGSVKLGNIEIPRVLEITYYNKNRGPPGPYRSEFPHPLDVDNCSAMAPLPLPRCWY